LAIHRARVIVALLLVLTAFIAFAAQTNLFNPPPVTGSPSLTLTPTSGVAGSEVSFTGYSFSSSDTICYVQMIGITAITVNLINPACAVIQSPSATTTTLTTAGTLTTSVSTASASLVLQGSFQIPLSTLPGQYVIRVNGCTPTSSTTGSVTAVGPPLPQGCGEGSGTVTFVGSIDFAEAIFLVVIPPKVALYTAPIVPPTCTTPGCTAWPPFTGGPPSGPTGTNVFFVGEGFSGADTGCTVLSPTFAGAVTVSACSVLSAGQTAPIDGATFTCPSTSVTATIMTTTTGTVTTSIPTECVVGSFTVGFVLPGEYVIQVEGVPIDDSAQAIFTVTTGPTLTLTPSSGETGTEVSFVGTGFLPTDSQCTVLSTTNAGAVHGGGSGAACAITLGSGTVHGSFTIGNVLPAQYVIRVTGIPGGDFADAVFNVTLGPALVLKPSAGEAGTVVEFTGISFSPLDVGCQVLSPTLTAAVTAGACVMRAGSTVATGSFTVGNVLPGEYQIRVTGISVGDYADAIFNVTSGPVLNPLVPPSGPIGTSVSFSGFSFLPTDNTCSVSSPSFAGLIIVPACVKVAGSTTVSGSFTVGNVLPGEYVVQVTGNGGDFGQTIFIVTLGPQITLTATSGMVGTSITVTGSGFLPTDGACVIGTGPTNLFNPILPGSAACAIRLGTGKLTGSFIIGNVPPGEYVIVATGTPGGDSAQAVLTVLASTPEFDLFPTSAANGATVTFRAYGLLPGDTGCIVVAYSGDITPAHLDNNLISSPTCSVVSSQTAQGSFVVGPYATEDIHWNVTVKGTPGNDLVPASATFSVMASITVTPTSGTVNTVFTYTGSGFESDATTCSATVVPAFGVEPSCGLGATTGQVSGSVVVPATASAGTYAIEVGDNTGSNATGIFTVGTPSALVQLNPAAVEQGQPVGVAGTGFNPQDMFCVINVGGVPTIGTPNCLIASGYASGSFTVSQTANGGYYLITIQACAVAPVANVCPAGDGLDFASNFLAVTLQSTITTFTPSTTSRTTTTSMSTTTTSVATSFSFSSTTRQTTGILYTTYTQFTVSTVSGLTTTTETSTSSTTQTQTTVTVSTTTSYTTVPCGPLPCGFVIQPESMNPAPVIDSTGLLAALLLLLPMLLRRLFG